MESTREDSRLFKDKIFLDTLTTPQGATIIGRDKEIKALSEYLYSYEEGLVVPFISVYGKSGTGKSATVELVCKKLEEKGLISFRSVNLRKARTVFGCATTILHELGGPTLRSSMGMNIAIDQIYESIEKITIKSGKIERKNQKELPTLVDVLEAEVEQRDQEKLFVLVLDEFDVLFHDRRGKPSDFVYSLLHIQEDLRRKGHQVCIVAISNRVVADYDLDDRVISRIGSSEIYFPAYSESELMEILGNRQALAFSRSVDQEVLQYCAQLSAKDHGDARRAIDLMRRAAEISTSRILEAATSGKEDGLVTISRDDVEAAFSELQKDKLTMTIKTLPHQMRLVIAAFARLSYLTNEPWISTSVLFAQYNFMFQKSLKKGVLRPLTRRRFAEILTEMRNLGLVESHTGSEGRHGYHTKYRLVEDAELIGSSIFPQEQWAKLVDLKDRRRDYIRTVLYSKAKSEYDRIKGHSGQRIETEMNDLIWTLEVHGNQYFEGLDFE